MMVARTLRFVMAAIVVALGSASLSQTPALPSSQADRKTAPTVVDWESLKGKVIYVDFWASWCTPCQQSFPWMNAMQAKYGRDGLVILAINLDQDPAKAAAFLARNPAQFTIQYDPKGQVAEQFSIKTMPTSFILNRKGQAVARHAGFHVGEIAQYEAALRKALLQTP